MEYHPFFGLCALERGWAPAPRYLLRRQRVLELLADQARGALLEVGCGAGALLHDLTRAGFACTALETSPAALTLARDLNGDCPGTDFQARPLPAWQGAFDLLVALEVLEHIEDDGATLARWRGWLKPDGLLLLSVPAHPRRWNATDVWAGHVRRYQRDGLQRLLVEAGFFVVHLECYGFPLANILEPIRARYHARLLRGRASLADLKRERKADSSRSGIDRSLEARLFPLLTGWGGRTIMRLAFSLQGAFSRTDWGNGYLVLARRLP